MPAMTQRGLLIRWDNWDKINLRGPDKLDGSYSCVFLSAEQVLEYDR